MFALVESGTITQFPKGNKGITIGDNQYPQSIYTVWTEAERNAIGIYTVTIDNTNRKDEAFYINTDVTYTFTGSAVTGTYGTATAKRLNDENAVDDDGNNILDDDGNQVINYGLKTQWINITKQRANDLLSKSDWEITRKSEKGTAIASATTTFRDKVRTACDTIETAIKNASNMTQFKALFDTPVDKDGNVTGNPPIHDFPEET